MCLSEAGHPARYPHRGPGARRAAVELGVGHAPIGDFHAQKTVEVVTGEYRIRESRGIYAAAGERAVVPVADCDIGGAEARPYPAVPVARLHRSESRAGGHRPHEPRAQRYCPTRLPHSYGSPLPAGDGVTASGFCQGHTTSGGVGGSCGRVCSGKRPERLSKKATMSATSFFFLVFFCSSRSITHTTTHKKVSRPL